MNDSPPIVQAVMDGFAFVTHGLRSVWTNSVERPSTNHQFQSQFQSQSQSQPSLSPILPPRASLTTDISRINAAGLVSPAAASAHTVSDDWQLIGDMDELTRNYFQRWATAVQYDTDRLIATHRQRERFRHWEKAGAKAGVALLLDEELVLDMESQLGDFELIHAVNVKQSDNTIVLGEECAGYHSTLTESEWNRDWIDSANGRPIKSARDLCLRAFYGGMEHKLRHRIWPYLCGLMDWRWTADQRKRQNRLLANNYSALEARWRLSLAENSSSASESLEGLAADRQYAVEKDVVRTDRGHLFFAQTESPGNAAELQDRKEIDASHGSLAYIENELQKYPAVAALRDILTTYALFQLEIGYVQGMNDLASPLLALFDCCDGDNVDTDEEPGMIPWAPFWLFAHMIDSRLGRFSGLLSGKESPPVKHFPLLDNFHQNQRGMRTRMILLTYLLRLMEPDFYRSLERMDDTDGGDGNDWSTGSGCTVGGATSLIWIFRGLLLLWKRELITTISPNASAKTSPSFRAVERLWEAYLAGCQLWTPFMDLWLTIAVLKVGGVISAVKAGKIESFEELLRAVHSMSLARFDNNLPLQDPDVLFDGCNRVVEECRIMMLRFDRISRELGIGKHCAIVGECSPSGYWVLGEPFPSDSAKLEEYGAEQKLNSDAIRIRFREALEMLQFIK